MSGGCQCGNCFDCERCGTPVTYISFDGRDWWESEDGEFADRAGRHDRATCESVRGAKVARYERQMCRRGGGRR
jgi:hypothetical protein